MSSEHRSPHAGTRTGSRLGKRATLEDEAGGVSAAFTSLIPVGLRDGAATMASAATAAAAPHTEQTGNQEAEPHAEVWVDTGERVRDAWDVLLLLDSHPTMGVWSSAVEGLTAELRRLGFRRVHDRRVDLTALRSDVAVIEDPPDAGADGRLLVVVVSDGASPGWRTGAAVDVLRAWNARHPTVVVHMLSQPQWYRTGIEAEAVQLRPTAPNLTGSRWDWRWSQVFAADPWIDPDAEPLPVFGATPDWLARLVPLVKGTDRWVYLSALLLSPDDAERPREVLPESGAPDARKLVEDFRAAVSPDTFRLATCLAAVPLDLAVMKGVQKRLLPRSTEENLAEFLISALISTQPAVRGKLLEIPFRLATDVGEELLAAARRSDLERVAVAVGDLFSDQPGAAQFAALLEGTLAKRLPAARGLAARRDELKWRQARAHVLMALGGPHYRIGEAELAALPQLPPAPGDAGTTKHAAGGRPVSANDVSQPPATPSGRSATGSPPEASPPAPTARRRAVLGEYPLRNPNFTGREDLLAELHASLASAETTAVLPQALHGMGGVGKSLLAIEYVHRHLDDYEIIWWVQAERTTGIQASLVRLGQRLGLPVTDEANTAVPIVLDALRRGDPYRDWLIVFDNAESPEQVVPFLPGGGTGHVLITSRDARWAQRAQPLEVDVFRREESVQLLQRRGPGISNEDADRLAEVLGDLPLAVEQAAAWHAETGMPAEEYLRLFDEKRVDLLEQGAPQDYQIPVIAAWNVSLDRLEARSPAALHLLQICAYFAAEPIPRTLFTNARSQKISSEFDRALRDPIRFSRALQEINRYSLARIDLRTNTIQMHRLVQAALIARMNEDQQETMRHAAHRVLAVNDPQEPENHDNFAVYGNLYPHLRASDAAHCDDAWVRGLVINEAKFLYRFGNHAASLALCLAALNAWRPKRTEDDTTTAMDELSVAEIAHQLSDNEQVLQIALWAGFVLFAVGNYDDAATLNAATLSAYNRLKAEGSDDPETTQTIQVGELEALRNVAIDLRAQGEFAKALAISHDVYERSMQAYGDDAPETLNAAHNLAVSLRLAGRFHEARDRDQDTLGRKEIAFGPDSPLTMITRLGWLVDLRELGQYADPQRERHPGHNHLEDLHERELNRAELALGDLNPVTLLARRLYAVAQRKAGRHEAARVTSELVCEQFRSRYPETHPEVMAAESNHAIDLRQTREGHPERLTEARQLGAELVTRYTAALGADHPHTLTAQVNLAIAYRLLGDAQRALELDAAAHEALSRRLGPDHPSTLTAAVNLASDLYVTGDVQAALDRDLDTWHRLVKVFGDRHPTTLACETNLAIDLRALGREDEAVRRHHHATLALDQLLGPIHPAVVEAESWEDRANCDLDPMPL